MVPWDAMGACRHAVTLGLMLVACVGEDAETEGTCGVPMACVGEGGCAGEQTCDARTRAYGPCVCAAAPADAGSTAEDARATTIPPTTGGIHLTLGLFEASGAPTTCAEQPKVRDLFVSIKPEDRNGSGSTLPCATTTQDFLALPFGKYRVTVSAIDSGYDIVGEAPPQDVELGGSAACDDVVGTSCVKFLSVAIEMR